MLENNATRLPSSTKPSTTPAASAASASAAASTSSAPSGIAFKSQCYVIKVRSRESMLCDSRRACGESLHFRVDRHTVGADGGNPRNPYEPRLSQAGTVPVCLPYFVMLGPEKTGTTDLFRKLMLARTVAPSDTKETGFWSEHVRNGVGHITLAGYALRYFHRVGEGAASALELTAALKSSSESKASEETRRRATELISGEASPNYLYWHHNGVQILPRWMHCLMPNVRLVVTFRNPVERTYSDYTYFTRIIAGRAKKSVAAAAQSGRSNHVVRQHQGLAEMTPTPGGFNSSMGKEVIEMRRCFVRVDGQLLFNPPPELALSLAQANKLSALDMEAEAKAEVEAKAKAKATSTSAKPNSDPLSFEELLNSKPTQHGHEPSAYELEVMKQSHDRERIRRKNELVRLSAGRRHVCEDIRRQQMEKLGFQSTRTPGRLLLSLYNMHLDQWLRYFPCGQILIVKPSGDGAAKRDGSSEVENICRFLDIAEEDCKTADMREREASYRGPEAEVRSTC